MKTKEFNLSEKKKSLYQDLINNIERAYDDFVNPIGIIQMFIKLSEEADKEFIKLLKVYLIAKGDKDTIKVIDKLAGDKLR